MYKYFSQNILLLQVHKKCDNQERYVLLAHILNYLSTQPLLFIFMFSTVGDFMIPTIYILF